MPNSIAMSWLYIFTACIRVFSSFSFLANSLMLSMYIRWLIFLCDLLSLYLAVIFLSMWLWHHHNYDSNSDSASPWNMPLWTFASAKLFPPSINSTFQVLMGFFLDKVYDFIWCFVHFEEVYYPALSEHITCLFCSQSGP